MQVLHLAIKNVIRYQQRTLITILAMAFAGGIMIFYASLLEGWLVTMEINAISMEMGEMQIHAPGYRKDPDLYTLITDHKQVINQIELAGFAAAGRLLGGGLAAAKENSTGVSIRGVDLKAEQKVVLLQNHIRSGNWLSENDRKGVVVGYQLAKILDVQPGSELVLVGQAADGSLANDLYIVRGILKSVGQGVDRGGLFMVEQDFRDFFVLEKGVHEIVVERTDYSDSLHVATQYLGDLFPHLEVVNWRQMQPTLARLLDLSNVSLVIMLLITYAAVGMLTMNAMLMGVFERIPQFGVMKAVGFSGPRLFGLIFLETVFQVSISTILAVAGGLPLSYYFEKNPLDFSFLLKDSSTIAGIAFEPQWYCHVTADSVLLPVVFLYVVAIVSIIYPAAKAAMISPVQAIHHN